MMLASVCQRQLFAGLPCQAVGAAVLCQLAGAPQQGAGRPILTGSPQKRTEPVPKPGLEHGHPTRRRERDRLAE